MLATLRLSFKTGRNKLKNCLIVPPIRQILWPRVVFFSFLKSFPAFLTRGGADCVALNVALREQNISVYYLYSFFAFIPYVVVLLCVVFYLPNLFQYYTIHHHHISKASCFCNNPQLSDSYNNTGGYNILLVSSLSRILYFYYIILILVFEMRLLQLFQFEFFHLIVNILSIIYVLLQPR